MLETEDMLQKIDRYVWRRSFTNMSSHEMRSWFFTNKWIIQLIIWQLLLNGLTLLMFISIQGDSEYCQALMGSLSPEIHNVLNGISNNQIVQTRIILITMIWFTLIGIFGIIGAIILMQSVLTDEYESETINWVLSAPIHRSSFLFAKFIGNSIAISALLILLPAIGVYLLIFAVTGIMMSLTSFLLAIAVLFFVILFYISFTLMLGTFFRSRGAILGIAIGFSFLQGFLPNSIAWLHPQAITSILPGIFLTGTIPTMDSIMLMITILLTAILFVVSLIRFQFEQF